MKIINQFKKRSPGEYIAEPRSSGTRKTRVHAIHYRLADDGLLISHFDAEGNETRTDYVKALKLVLEAGYRGHVGVEYEGGKISEEAGIIATKKLLLKVRSQLAGLYK